MLCLTPAERWAGPLFASFIRLLLSFASHLGLRQSQAERASLSVPRALARPGKLADEPWTAEAGMSEASCLSIAGGSYYIVVARAVVWWVRTPYIINMLLLGRSILAMPGPLRIARPAPPPPWPDHGPTQLRISVGHLVACLLGLSVSSGKFCEGVCVSFEHGTYSWTCSFSAEAEIIVPACFLRLGRILYTVRTKQQT